MLYTQAVRDRWRILSPRRRQHCCIFVSFDLAVTSIRVMCPVEPGRVAGSAVACRKHFVCFHVLLGLALLSHIAVTVRRGLFLLALFPSQMGEIVSALSSCSAQTSSLNPKYAAMNTEIAVATTSEIVCSTYKIPLDVALVKIRGEERT